ncbi:MAG: hypothetical protein SFT94_05740 [Pseudanabaenaceae cyanobacterium bins.68]|nr:hypothetical protein [Pseudanabaenaceae cyanobacterium bins.68]
MIQKSQNFPSLISQVLAKIITISTLGLVAASLTSLPVVADDREDSAPVDRVISCLRSASAAQPGRVKEVEIEQDDRFRVCKVKIYRNGREYEVKVNLANGRVLKVEQD